jgi:hypothetical protein
VEKSPLPVRAMRNFTDPARKIFAADLSVKHGECPSGKRFYKNLRRGWTVD